MGDAWGHLAVEVEDLHAAWNDLIVREADDYRDPDSCGDDYAFTRDQDGHEIELIERNAGEPLFPI
jgi:lactoylglutathione lyase